MMRFAPLLCVGLLTCLATTAKGQGDTVSIIHTIPERQLTIADRFSDGFSEDRILFLGNPVSGGGFEEGAIDLRSPYPLRTLVGRDLTLRNNGYTDLFAITSVGPNAIEIANGALVLNQTQFLTTYGTPPVGPRVVNTDGVESIGFQSSSIGGADSTSTYTDFDSPPTFIGSQSVSGGNFPGVEEDTFTPYYSIRQTGRIGISRYVGTLNGGTVTVDYRYAETAQGSTPIQIIAGGASDPSPQPFSDNLRNIPLPREQIVPVNNSLDGIEPIGVVDSVVGNLEIRRIDGTGTNAALGTLIYAGDRLETNSEGEAKILFIGESSLTLRENQQITIDEFIFDPTSEPGTPDFSILRGVFMFTSGLIGRDDPNDPNFEPQGSIGIRGFIVPVDDPDEIEERRTNAIREGVAIRRRASSPTAPQEVDFFTNLDLPEESFDIIFDYIFLDQSGELEITLGGIPIARLLADSESLGDFQRIEITIDDPSLLSLDSAELAITYDGEEDSTFVIDNLYIGDEPGVVDVASFASRFFARGNGEVLPAFFVAVPEPGSLALSLLGLAAAVASRTMSRRRREGSD